MIRRPPRSTQSRSSAASDVYKRQTLQFVRETLRQSLSIYTQNVSNHLKTLPIVKRIDSTLATTEEKYHLYMLEIELVNRIHREDFKRSEYKFALIAHCLRDFRPGCRSEEGEFEAVCRGWTEDCFIHPVSYTHLTLPTIYSV